MSLKEELKKNPDLWEHYRALGRKMVAVQQIDEYEKQRTNIQADAKLSSQEKAAKVAEIDVWLGRLHAGIEMLHKQRPEIVDMDPRKFPTEITLENEEALSAK